MSKRKSDKKLMKTLKRRLGVSDIAFIEPEVYRTNLAPISQEFLDAYRKEFPERDVPATMAEWESRQRGATP